MTVKSDDIEIEITDRVIGETVSATRRSSRNTFMIPKVTVPCPACHGSGRVPHEKRTINGVVDPWDLKEEDLCTPCGASGCVPAPGPDPDPVPVAALRLTTDETLFLREMWDARVKWMHEHPERAAIDHGDCCG